jgi:16S rRNA (guanine1207-N2)-methyltransferase
MGSHYFDVEPSTPLETRELALTVDKVTVNLTSARGVFGWQRIDLGTSVLIRYGPRPPGAGEILDLGCGYGPISIAAALRAPGARVWSVDVNRRALEMTRANAARLGLSNVEVREPEAVPPDVVFTAIYSNPPIKVGKSVLHSMLDLWLPRLTPDGHAYLVVKRSMGSDTLELRLKESGWCASRLRSKNGYRIIDIAVPAGTRVRPLASIGER